MTVQPTRNTPSSDTVRHPTGVYLVRSGYGGAGEHVDVELRPAGSFVALVPLYVVFTLPVLGGTAVLNLTESPFTALATALALVFFGLAARKLHARRMKSVASGRITTFTIPVVPPATPFEQALHDVTSQPTQGVWVNLSSVTGDVTRLLEATTTAAQARANTADNRDLTATLTGLTVRCDDATRNVTKLLTTNS